MKKYAKIFGLLFAALCIASMVFSACRKEMPPVPELPPPPPDTTYDEYNGDSTGIAISDSILVIFGDSTGNLRWSTLEYESRIEVDSLGTHLEWIFIDAHYPGQAYPLFSLKILREVGNHSGHMNPTIVTTVEAPSTPPQTYSMPVPSLAGDVKCGSLYYFSSDSAANALRMTDGLQLGDWWPWELTTSVLSIDFVDGQMLLTGRCTAKMFNYLDWITAQQAGAPVNVEDVAVKNIAISFGGLKINRN